MMLGIVCRPAAEDMKRTELYQDDKWLHNVISERANIELMLVDRCWARFKFERAYRFAMPVLNVTTMVDGHRWVALAQVPYLIWVATAMVLQLSITAMNWAK